MPASYPWRPSRLLVILSALIQCTEACFDSSGDFYCASLWYFWFCVFWFCVGLLVMTICIVNRCNKTKNKVDVELTLPPSFANRNTASETTSATDRSVWTTSTTTTTTDSGGH